MLARGVRNVIYNYTDAQRKVRSATSNDAWGPSPALMHEIADLTDNIVAFAEIMPIVWKRLNDHGKNWRHVYKSLVLLDHLIKYGNERVSQQCKENIFAIQTLKDFQYVEDQKDQGYNVREKAKQLVALLKDDERLRNERRKAHDARERYGRQAMGMDSNGAVTYGRSATTSSMRRNSLEGGDSYGGTSYLSSNNANQYSAAQRSTSYNDSLHASGGRGYVLPASAEEEQLQMQIAMAESQREAEDQERVRRNDDLKLKMALERSVSETSPDANHPQLFDFNPNSQRHNASPLFDTYQNDSLHPSVTTTSHIGWNTTDSRPPAQLGFSSATNDPWTLPSTDYPSASAASNDPWQGSTASAWQPPTTSQPNPWTGNNQTTPNNNNTGLSINISDPWSLGASNSRPSATVSPPPATSTSINNELSDFFGGGTTVASSFDQQRLASSNPWNTTSSPMATGSTSPLTSSNGNYLYPTIASGNNSNPTSTSPVPSSISASRKTPESFLGDKFSTLVNLDQLVTEPKSTNPFGGNNNVSRVPNPFSSATRAPTLDQLTTSNNSTFTSGSPLPPPLIPSSYSSNNNASIPAFNTNNPFM